MLIAKENSWFSGSLENRTQGPKQRDPSHMVQICGLWGRGSTFTVLTIYRNKICRRGTGTAATSAWPFILPNVWVWISSANNYFHPAVSEHLFRRFPFRMNSAPISAIYGCNVGQQTHACVSEFVCLCLYTCEWDGSSCVSNLRRRRLCMLPASFAS